MLQRWTELEENAPDLTKKSCFITLTSKDPLPYAQIQAGYHRVAQALRRAGYRYFCCTSAVQDKRLKKYGDSVEHYHLIAFGVDFIPAALVRKAWGLGGTFHKRADCPLHTLRYMNYLLGNGGRLSWSYTMIKRLPAGARPHANCYRWVKSDPVNNFPGGIINFGWGNLRYVGASPLTGEALVYVPGLGRVVPSVAGCDHRLLWTCWRMTTDWQQLRNRMTDKVEDENDFIDRLRRGVVHSTSARYLLALGREISTDKGD